MKLIIAGGRDFNDWDLLQKGVMEYLILFGGRHDLEIVSGGANGADKLGERFAEGLNMPLKRFLPDYERFGSKQAPLTRNCDMADYADGLLAFWDGKSKGTGHMIAQAGKRNLKIHIVNY